MDGTPSMRLAGISCLCFSGLFLLTSCETLKAPGSTADWFARNNKSRARQDQEVERYRQQWQTRRDGAAIRWLLSTQIHNGLTPEQVDDRLGDTGEREQNSMEFKKTGDGFRIDDVFYRYGPDRDGQVYYLAFREGMLVNFAPEYFEKKG